MGEGWGWDSGHAFTSHRFKPADLSLGRHFHASDGVSSVELDSDKLATDAHDTLHVLTRSPSTYRAWSRFKKQAKRKED